MSHIRIASRNLRHRSSVIQGGLLVLLMLTLSSGPAAAQQLRGTVSDIESGDPIPSVQVWLQSAEGEDLRLTFTLEDGSFLIEPDSAGVYRLEARRQGYETSASTTFRWPGLDGPVDLQMPARPIELEGVEVEAQADVRLEHQATYAGLYRRALDTAPVGRRRVYLRDKLEFDDFRTVQEFVRQQNVPGVGRRGVIMEGGRAPPPGYRAGCDPHLVWAGFEAPVDVSEDPVARPQYLSFRVSDLEAIELYGRATEAPMGVRPANPEQDNFCGLIVLWPRRADEDPDGGLQ